MRPKAEKVIKAKEGRLSFLNPFSRAKRFSPKNILAREINRARRHGQGIGVLMVDIKGPMPRGTHKLLPGITLSVEWFNHRLRHYDYVERSGLRRYTVLLPQVDAQGVEAVKNRIMSLAREMGWTHANIGAAVYPQDGEKAEVLLEQARLNLMESRKRGKTVLEPLLSHEEFKRLI